MTIDAMRPRSDFMDEIVEVGATVWVLDELTSQATELHIVGELDADETLDRISVFSPLARQLLGKKCGALITVASPQGPVPLKILNIRRA